MRSSGWVVDMRITARKTQLVEPVVNRVQTR
jgi:hypothetical protein